MNFNSQFGEDKWLVENHIIDVSKKGFFLDIGAGDPIRLSNTYYFEQNGWDGICIDADPRTFMDLLNKRKKVIFGVINTHDGLETFNISQHGADLSSIKVETEAQKSTVACFTIKTLFNRFDIPKKIDLLSIDIEGHEIPILKDLFQIRKPEVMIIEYDKDENDVEGFMKQKGYSLILRNQANLIYKKI
jgi:FkbM family methyltransferase